MRRLLPALFFALAAHYAFAESKAWQDTITLSTWLEGPPSVDPKLDALDPGLSYYPYTNRRNFTATREPRVWRRLNLENEYLKCSFLPDIGGHLYSCVDKRNGRPLFRVNDSVKKADVALRGAWVSMGIEFNFPVAHSRDTVSPVDFAIRQENDHAEVWVGDTDRVTGMRWLAQFILRDGSAELEQHITLSNPTPARHPYLWWSDADVLLDAATHFVVPTYVMSSHGRKELTSWPVDKGKDLSRPFGRAEIALFSYSSLEPYLAAYYSDTRAATVHVADPTTVAGKKIYHLGESVLPYWREHLSDSKDDFVEIQAGLFENQETYRYLQPGEQRQFTELWMGGRDLNGVTRANEHAILSLERVPASGKSNLVTQLNVTQSIPDAFVALYKGETSVWKDKIYLSPAQTYQRVFPNPERDASYRFELRDSTGKLLLGHTEGAYAAMPADSVKLGAQPSLEPGKQRQSAADYLAAAGFDERSSLYRFAEGEYREGLKKFPNDLQLHKRLGRLLVIQRRYQEAAQELAAANEKLLLDPELRYYFGIALAASDKDDEARKSWLVAAPDAAFGPPSLLQLAMLDSRQGHAASALEIAGQAIARRPSLLAARKLEATLLRHAGRAEDARAQLAQAAAIDPLDSFFRFEATLDGGKDDGLWPHLAADPQRVLNLADSYMSFGFYSDALTVLSHTYEAVPANQSEPSARLPQNDALMSYFRGYCQSKLGHDASADFKLAASQPLEYVFPHRASAAAVLAAAEAANPRDASALYLNGLLDLDQNRDAAAIAKFKAALALRKDIPAIHYVLGRSLLLFSASKTEGLATLEEGAALNRSDRELKSAIDAARHPRTAAPVAGGAPAPALPSKLTGTPEENAQEILDRTAAGEPDTISLFSPQNFPETKVSPEVLRAYIETQLQMLRRGAAKKDCATAMTALDKMGSEDPRLPFTLQGFDAYIKGARLQYFLGAVESLCGLSKDARRRWTKVAQMAPDVSSADFAFPAVAAQSLAPSGKASDITPKLEQIAHALDRTDGDSNGLLYYSRGILLLVKGDEHEAIRAFREGTKSDDRDWSGYLNRSALSDAGRAGK